MTTTTPVPFDPLLVSLCSVIASLAHPEVALKGFGVHGSSQSHARHHYSASGFRENHYETSMASMAAKQ